MALGAEAVAREAFGEDVRIAHFEQHHPFSVYPEGHWTRWIDKLRHDRLMWLRRRLAREDVYQKMWAQTQPLEFDLAVACGGPNLVSGAAATPQMRLLMHHFNGAFAFRGTPVLDAAVGSGFPLERIPERLSPEDEAFYKTSTGITRAITVREHDACRLYGTIGVEAPVIPCIAIGSGRFFQRFRDEADRSGTPRDERPIIINFQAKGSNTDWDQGVDPAAWMDLVRGVVADLRADGQRVELLCHSLYERKLARQLAPDLPIHFPQTEEEYGHIIANAKVGFVSRIHAGVALAGIGVPSLVVGNDTRIGTTAEMGLPSYFTKKLDRDTVVAEIRRLVSSADAERERLLALRESVIKRYAEVFATCAENQS
ncbi:hypothetical protein [Caenispirillum salinarum]|nr:hypothetical protein [Caenispirillum salinarum]